MAILRVIKCDVCGKEQVEEQINGGWVGWGALHGIKLNDTENPSLCPPCLNKVAKFINNLTEGN